MPHGVVAHFDAGMAQAPRHHLEVVGETGTLFLADPWHCAHPGIELRREGGTETIAVPEADPYRMQAEHFARVVSGTEPSRLPARDGLAQARAIEALYAAADRCRLAADLRPHDLFAAALGAPAIRQRLDDAQSHAAELTLGGGDVRGGARPRRIADLDPQRLLRPARRAAGCDPCRGSRSGARRWSPARWRRASRRRSAVRRGRDPGSPPARWPVPTRRTQGWSRNSAGCR